MVSVISVVGMRHPCITAKASHLTYRRATAPIIAPNPTPAAAGIPVALGAKLSDDVVAAAVTLLTTLLALDSTLLILDPAADATELTSLLTLEMIEAAAPVAVEAASSAELITLAALLVISDARDPAESTADVAALPPAEVTELTKELTSTASARPAAEAMIARLLKRMMSLFCSAAEWIA